MGKDLLLRAFDLKIERADENKEKEGLTLFGHAAVFNVETVIDSWEGTFRERLAPGAFTKTLSERTPVIQFDHGYHPLIGSIPIGTLREAKEDAVGLYIEVELHDNWLIQPVRDAIASGAVTGMSFRFRVVKEEFDDSNSDELPLRTIKEVQLYEAGPVVWPAYEETTVGVRTGDLNKLVEIRQRLVENDMALIGTRSEPSQDTPERAADEAKETVTDEATEEVAPSADPDYKARLRRALQLRGVTDAKASKGNAA